jgi:hypothetical protein
MGGGAFRRGGVVLDPATKHIKIFELDEGAKPIRKALSVARYSILVPCWYMEVEINSCEFIALSNTKPFTPADAKSRVIEYLEEGC